MPSSHLLPTTGGHLISGSFCFPAHPGGNKQQPLCAKDLNSSVLVAKCGCFCSVTKLCLTLCNSRDCSRPGSSVPYYLSEFFKFKSIELVMLSNHLILCCSLLLLTSIFPSISTFSSELALHVRWPKYWRFSFSISPSNEYSEFISFRIDWFDHHALQGALKSLFQHHNLKASILQHSVLCMVQLSHLYMYWKNDSFDCMVLCHQSDISEF